MRRLLSGHFCAMPCRAMGCGKIRQTRHAEGVPILLSAPTERRAAISLHFSVLGRLQIEPLLAARPKPLKFREIAADDVRLMGPDPGAGRKRAARNPVGVSLRRRYRRRFALTLRPAILGRIATNDRAARIRSARRAWRCRPVGSGCLERAGIGQQVAVVIGAPRKGQPHRHAGV